MDQATMTQLLEEMSAMRKLLSPQSRRSTMRMPHGMQRAVRQVIRKLQEDEETPLVLSFDRFGNNDVKMIVREVQMAYRDYNWAHGTVEEAVKRVWRNLRDEKKREENGKKEEHRKKNKMAKRTRDKLRSRENQLERDDHFSKEDKKKIRKALVPEATSPEVTDDEDDTRRVSIPFIWESSTLRDIKRDLDNGYRDALSTQSRRQRARVSASVTSVTRTPPPTFLPSWAISSTYNS
uniref:Uncharacterized protein LOC111121825 n=1 Tax=Crassostrea virginica TaxID=6565 RepID=A0A8B8CTB8_CRAVI|nr:uncharacterized protein LOC111121825 [Crassostrea virginica]